MRVCYFFFLIVLLLNSVIVYAATKASSEGIEYRAIEWVDLIPKSDLDVLLNPPKSITSISHGLSDINLDQLSGSITDALTKNQRPPSPEEQAYSAALESTKVNEEYDDVNIRLPGYIVPIEFDDNMVITAFFLVPYFGACIHVPPPPPNQILYVKYPEGLVLEALYHPFWIEGKVSTTLIENDIAVSAYTVDAAAVKPYTIE